MNTSSLPDQPAAPESAEAASPRLGGTVLKLCIFATGFSGIVAEYAMATLASYLLGNAVLQWTLTISLMLFAMGVGSRFSQYAEDRVLEAFIWAELGLSILCAISAPLIYLLAGFVENLTPFIYGISMAIGFLIGLEVPLATRINQQYEELRVNISAVMEKDYYGALLGGLLFAFVALPYLGLTYTPILLGLVNLVAALALTRVFGAQLAGRNILNFAFVLLFLGFFLLTAVAEPIVMYGEQKKYRDKVVYQEQTPYQRIVLTRWKDDYWLYLNGHQQFSSYDEALYHEPLVHPAMGLSASHRRVLILGGGDGLAARELLKYDSVETIVLVDLDPAVTRLANQHPFLSELNQGALQDPRVQVVHGDAYSYLKQTQALYDVILIDLPDPKTVDLARLYTVEFYRLAEHHLATGGVMVTQAGSPFFSRQAFLCIWNSMAAAELQTTGFHNHIPTMGEWGWILGWKVPPQAAVDVRASILALPEPTVPTRYLNRDAIQSMFHFGKGVVDDREKVPVNRESDLVLQRLYKGGRWDFY
ncbi:polyamine aminopropyltransferase [Acanthopleuribacter pedis]|uniref:Polyamine aminopropyltransferase n=1 Tax=Acanthopleuribacter pedis TaxID=442870 RepID=A0A8J7QQC6_9BACT|nr:polyamine aminopropyltransferase [Acanthopleuribacter pedis]MBO1322225.1 polyamine aminopropyltransferase [Acanthopleuribacter pedis]